MHITFIVPYKGLSGGLKVITSYGNSFLRRGHTVSICYPKTNPGFKKSIKNRWERLKGYRDHLDEFKGNLLPIPKLAPEYFPQSDVLIATGWETTNSVLQSNIKKKFYFVQHIETWGGKEEEVLKTYKLGIPMITISNWLRESLEEISGIKDIPVVFNGKDFFLSEYSGEGIEKKYDIGMIVTGVRFKRSDVGLEVIRQLREKKPGLRVILFGPSKPIYPIPQDIPFHLSPPQNKIREFYTSTKIWLNTSDLEGFCLPALEAMSLGSVVVATDSKGIRDIINDGEDGFLSEPGKPEILTDRCLKLLENSDVLSKIMVNGLIKSEKFSWEKSSELFLKILEAG